MKVSGFCGGAMAELLLCWEYMIATMVLNQTSSGNLSIVIRNLVSQPAVAECGAVPRTQSLEQATGEEVETPGH